MSHCETSPPPTILESALASQAAALALARSATDGARATGAVLRHQLKERPYAALAVVVGVGFVVGGGLGSPALRGLASIGARLALAAGARKLGEIVVAKVFDASDIQP